MRALLNNKILLIVLGLGLAGVVWYSFLGGSGGPAPLLTSEDVISENSQDSDVVRTLLTLRSVSLSGTIFSDPAFMALDDFGQEIAQEPVGRINPFAPTDQVAPPTQTPTTPNQQNPTGPGVQRPIPPAPTQ